MRKLLAVVGLVLAAGWAARAADDDAKKAAKKLDGSYAVVSATRGGKPDPKGKEVKSFTIQDGVLTISGERDEKAKFTVDPSKTPAHMDLMPRDDRTVQAIYQTKETDKGFELTIAFVVGPDGTRPNDFKGEGEHEVVIKLLRKKEK